MAVSLTERSRKVNEIRLNNITDSQSNMVSINPHKQSRRGNDKRNVILAAFVGLFLSACQAQEPKGQVIANLPGSEVTAEELRHELRIDSEINSKQALDKIIERKILAKAAEEQNLHLDPNFHFALRKAREDLLVKKLTDTKSSSPPTRQEEAIWIEINRQPWRYKDRFRLYLTRNDENGARSIFWIDTADYDAPLSEELMIAQPGEVVTIDGQVWTIHLRETLVTSPEKMIEANISEYETEYVSNALKEIVVNVKNRGQIVYQDGYGPASIED